MNSPLSAVITGICPLTLFPGMWHVTFQVTVGDMTFQNCTTQFFLGTPSSRNDEITSLDLFLALESAGDQREELEALLFETVRLYEW